jgi:hypothetical protein
MTYATDGKFSFANTASLFKGNIFAQHTSPLYNLGFKVEYADGRVFRYSHFGADTAAGLLVATDESESSVADTDNAVIASASAVTTTDGAIGSRFVQLTLASAAANQYAGGTLHTSDDAGEGYTYSIIGNTATNDPATGDIRIEFKETIQVALTTATDVIIKGSVYANLEAATAGIDLAMAGVSIKAVDVSDKEYGFVQESGKATLLTDGTPIVGSKLTLSDGVAGAVQLTDSETEPHIGYSTDAGDTTGHTTVMLQLR